MSEVANEISSEATVRFTVALIRSNDGASLGLGGISKRLLIYSSVLLGSTFEIDLFSLSDCLTIALEKEVESKRSSPASCFARFTSVSVTLLAFLDIQRVMTITIPEARSIHILAWTGALSAPISIPVSPPFATAIWYESNPAINTPMKLTRSLPANASASAKVPESTVILRIFTFSQASSDIKRLQNTKAMATHIQILSLI